MTDTKMEEKPIEVTEFPRATLVEKPEDIEQQQQNHPQQTAGAELKEAADPTTNKTGGVVKRQYSANRPMERTGGTARYLLGNTEEITREQETHESTFGFGFIFINTGYLNMSGAFVVPKNMRILILMHGCTIDFSRATFVHKVTNIAIFHICGGVRITIPRGVKIESCGFSICGGGPQLDEYSAEINHPVEQSPLIKVSMFALCAGTSVEVNKAVDPLIIEEHEVQNTMTIV